MAKRITATVAGVTETEVPEGVSVLPDALKEQVAESEPLEVGTLDELETWLNNGGEYIEAIEVFAGGKLWPFGIRKLSIKEADALAKKRKRQTPNGAIVPSLDAKEAIRNHALAECVKRNAGTPDSPQWVQWKTFEQIAGDGKDKKGLLDNPEPVVEELIDELQGQVFRLNQSISPYFLAQLDAVLDG